MSPPEPTAQELQEAMRIAHDNDRLMRDAKGMRNAYQMAGAKVTTNPHKVQRYPEDMARTAAQNRAEYQTTLKIRTTILGVGLAVLLIAGLIALIRGVWGI